VELQTLRPYSIERNPKGQLAEIELAAVEGEKLVLEQRGGKPALAHLGLPDVAGVKGEFLRAEHELQYRQTQLDQLVRKYDAARLDEAKQAAGFQVVEEALPPYQRSAPHRSLIVLGFAVLGPLSVCSYLLRCMYARSNPDLQYWVADFKAAIFRRQGRSLFSGPGKTECVDPPQP
jgi:hypothetical protein